MSPSSVHRWPATALVVAFAVALTGCTGATASRLDVTMAPVADPPARASDLEDAQWPAVAAWIAREAEAGRPTVVNLFASWCAPCRAEAPVLRRGIDNHDEVAWLGVAHRDERDAAAAFLRAESLIMATVFDPDGTVASAVGSRGLPTTAFFDHTGTLVYVHFGVLTEPVLAQRLADLTAAARST